MIHQYEAWNGEIPNNISDNDVFIQCNFSQFTPDTELFLNRTGLVFIDCNLVNCKLPADAEADGCNTSQNIYEEIDDVEI